MKYPWMSLWLSAVNRNAAAARGLWLAEAERQRRAFAKAAIRAAFPSAKKQAPSEHQPK